VFEAIRGGAEEYLVKPVTKKEVQNIWQHVWKRLSAAKLLREQQEVRTQLQCNWHATYTRSN
jgi:YesN/AraC family two-component response regulator